METEERMRWIDETLIVPMYSNRVIRRKPMNIIYVVETNMEFNFEIERSPANINGFYWSFNFSI